MYLKKFKNKKNTTMIVFGNNQIFYLYSYIKHLIKIGWL